MRDGRIAIVTFSPQGLCLAEQINVHLQGCLIFAHESLWNIKNPQVEQTISEPYVSSFTHLMELVAVEFRTFVCWIFIAPCGVAVRAIAPHIVNKQIDPAVLVVDAGGRYVVSLLSGHEGGGNAFAVEVSNILAAEPVISTTTEAVKTWIAGIGCRKGTSCTTILEVLDEGLQRVGISRGSLRFLATIALKRNEPGLRQVSEIVGAPLRIIEAEQIRLIAPIVGFHHVVQQRIGLPGVAEPAALLGGRRTRLCLPRIAHKGVTVALAQENCWSWELAPEVGKIELIELSKPSSNVN